MDFATAFDFEENEKSVYDAMSLDIDGYATEASQHNNYLCDLFFDEEHQEVEYGPMSPVLPLKIMH